MNRRVLYAKRRAEQVATFVASPDAREMLPFVQNPARKLVLKSIMNTPGLPDFLYRQLISKPYSSDGSHLIGRGAHAVVVSDGSSLVRKFYPESEFLSEEEQIILMEKWKAKQALSLEHLAPFAIEQTFSIEPHPLDRHGLSIISASQPLIDVDRVIQFRALQSDSAAAEFLTASQQMSEHTAPATIPDVIGYGNVAVEANTGAIRLVDPISLSSIDPEDTFAYNRASDALGIPRK